MSLIDIKRSILFILNVLLSIFLFVFSMDTVTDYSNNSYNPLTVHQSLNEEEKQTSRCHEETIDIFPGIANLKVELTVSP